MSTPGRVDQRILDRLRDASERLTDVDRELASPDVMQDMDRLRVLGRERSELAPRVELADRMLGLIDEHEGARELLRETDDPEMRRMAEEELAALEARIAGLRQALPNADAVRSLPLSVQTDSSTDCLLAPGGKSSCVAP